MNATQFLLAQQAPRFEQDCRSAQARVASARTMWEVNRAAHVVAPSLLRGVRLQRQGAGQQLAQAALKRMEALLSAQLKEAAAIPDLEARKAFLGRLRMREWDALRGAFAMLYRQADMEGRKLLAQS